MDNTIIENAIYYGRYKQNSTTLEVLGIQATIDSVEMSVPLDPANRHYAEIMRQVEAGTLIIQDAEPQQPE